MSLRDSFIPYGDSVIVGAFYTSIFAKNQLLKLYLTYYLLPKLFYYFFYEFLYIAPTDYTDPILYVGYVGVFVRLFALAPFIYTVVLVYSKSIVKNNDYYVLFAKKEVVYLGLFLFVLYLIRLVFEIYVFLPIPLDIKFFYVFKIAMFTLFLLLSSLYTLKKYLRSEYRGLNCKYLFLFTMFFCAPLFVFVENYWFILVSKLYEFSDKVMPAFSEDLLSVIISQLTLVVYFVVLALLLKIFIIAVIKQNDLNIARFAKENQ